MDAVDVRVLPGRTMRVQAWELLATFQDAARDREARAALGRTSGIRDTALLDGLHRLGVTPEVVPVLDLLVPAILVGWADGTMSRLERDRLRAIAALNGVDEGHAAWPFVQHRMLQPPTAEDADLLLRAARARLDRLPPRARERRRRTILQHCDAVARVSARTLGGPKVSREERDTMSEVAARIGA